MLQSALRNKQATTKKKKKENRHGWKQVSCKSARPESPGNAARCAREEILRSEYAKPRGYSRLRRRGTTAQVTAIRSEHGPGSVA